MLAYESDFTEVIICRTCGHKSLMVKLSGDTKLCCPTCKTWETFENLTKSSNIGYCCSGKLVFK